MVCDPVGMKSKYSFEWALDKRANGLDYARVTKYSLTGTVDRLHTHMDNLFNGDKLRGNHLFYSIYYIYFPGF